MCFCIERGGNLRSILQSYCELKFSGQLYPWGAISENGQCTCISETLWMLICLQVHRWLNHLKTLTQWMAEWGLRAGSPILLGLLLLNIDMWQWWKAMRNDDVLMKKQWRTTKDNKLYNRTIVLRLNNVMTIGQLWVQCSLEELWDEGETNLYSVKSKPIIYTKL